jgi:L-ribulokinase
MVIIMGTSNCHMIVSEELHAVPGMCGVVEGGILPGYYGYEAGQSGVGDIFAWFVDHAVPPEYHEMAESEGIDLHSLLEREAGKLKVGESGLLALDWINGNRSTLVDVDLTGLIVGLTLSTRAPEIYRALIESTAYGTRVIIEALEEGGVPVQEVIAAGGLPERNKMLMQIYADVTGRTFKVVGAEQAPAVGAAMHGAVAAGADAGGYADIVEAAEHMAALKDVVYEPIPENKAVYDKLYADYVTLYDTFGRGENDVMKRLLAIRDEALGLE